MRLITIRIRAATGGTVTSWTESNHGPTPTANDNQSYLGCSGWRNQRTVPGWAGCDWDAFAFRVTGAGGGGKKLRG